MGICYIVGAGEDFLPFRPNKDDFIIAADGGLVALQINNIRADLLVGDFDSLAGSVPIPTAIPRLSFPVEKDETDTYLAFLEGYRLGYRDFVLLACTGGRADHTFANYQLLLAIKNKGANATLSDGKNRVFCIKNELAELSCKVGTRVSVFALDGVASGISLRGFSYPLV